jgi:rod shape-determining protein MreD
MRIDSVAPDLLALVAICAGLAGGTELGAVMGFFAGLVADLFLTDTAFGLTALTLCLVGAGVGAVRANALPEGWFLTPLIAFAGTLASVIGFLAFADLVGQSQVAHEGSAWVVRVAFIESVVAAVLALPVFRLVSWAARGTTGARRLRDVGAGAAA